MSTTHRLVRIELDQQSLSGANADIEHERKIAVYDLLQDNNFKPMAEEELRGEGPYALYLSSREGRLIFDVRKEDDAEIGQFHMSVSPLRRTIKDYFLLCESYYDAIRSATPEHIETIDMARRSMHNEGAEILAARLKDKIEIDFNTGRRLFTLICSFHMKGR